MLNERGVFPGPREPWEDFKKRAESCTFKSVAPALVQELFEASPDWVEVKVDSKGLSPWEGAVTWIEEEEGKRTATVQVRRSLPEFLYSQNEMISHEMVHAMRLMFDENRFEEILAFQTSKNAFRRYFGPLFSKPIEVKLFLVSVVVSWVGIWIDRWWGIIFLFLPLLVLGFSVVRLIRSQRIFLRALKKAANLVKKPINPLSLLLRLSDLEIERFAQSNRDEIIRFIALEKEHNERWRFLVESFF